MKPSIDKVYGIADVGELIAYLNTPAHPPEARLLAGARVKAISETAADKRLPRPDASMDYVDACLVGLGSLDWVCLTHYGTDLDPHSDQGAPRPAEFENTLAKHLEVL